MTRLLPALLLALAPCLLSAQGIEGRIEGRTYVSPTGLFKVAIPVLPDVASTTVWPG